MQKCLQAAATLLLLTTFHTAAGNGEVGSAPNACYSAIPSSLPISISYTKAASPTTTMYNFLVNVQQASVDAFGIRLSPQLAAEPDRIIAEPAGQVVPPSLGGPAYLWLINSTGLELFSFTVDTTGLAEGSFPDLSAICAQGIVVANDQGVPIWQQTPASVCVVWVKQGANCTFQSISDSAQLPYPSAPSAAPAAAPAVGRPSFAPISFHAPPSPPQPYGYYSSAPSPSLPFASPYGYYSSPYMAYVYTPGPGPRASSSPSPLYGSPNPSSSPSPYAAPYVKASPSPYAKPSPAPSPTIQSRPSASPYASPTSSPHLWTQPIPSPSPSPVSYAPSSYAKPSPSMVQPTSSPSPYTPAGSPHYSSPYPGSPYNGSPSPGPYYSSSRSLLAASDQNRLFSSRRVRGLVTDEDL